MIPAACNNYSAIHLFLAIPLTGNKKSLKDAVEKGVNLREQILRLYHDNYRGGSMKLAVIGGESLDILESWVLELFSSVKKGPLENLDEETELPIWKAGKVYC
ncbi:hypothetical protein HAX54_006674 [Datura stramonium]|uniref:Peptidase M16 C-terminal domain-containing protein n=1 Tax=Datura stramonium TaxID=4076 RepID=A0ABS8TCC1_DATST|nr:hypothetical protein [Datura stramonium]